MALGGVLLIIKWTYDYPLIRLAASVALFFCALYLMRVLGKLGLAFFVVALAVIYAQTFPSMTSQSEIPCGCCFGCGWRLTPRSSSPCWSTPAFSRPFPVTSLRRAWPGCCTRSPGGWRPRTLKRHRPSARPPRSSISCSRCSPVPAGRHRRSPPILAWRSRLAATLRCYQLAALLQADEADSDDRQQLSQAVLQLKNALSEEPFDGAIPPLTLSGRGVNRAVLQEMATTLQRLAQGEPVALPQGEVEKAPCWRRTPGATRHISILRSRPCWRP